MKTAFSTLACPGYDFQDIYTMAADLGFDGIEVRGLGLDLFDRRTMPFAKENIPATAAKLRSLGLKISCFSSGVILSDASRREENIAEAKEYIRAAAAVGTNF
ncbi:MAG: sugar phosphate isomerase/epimerase, partial [Clostridia bacterium]|nr:sugar phosphate isomerase/epimerase [Clostridia bacterium]